MPQVFIAVLLLLLAPPDAQRAYDLLSAGRFKQAVTAFEEVLPNLEGEARADAQYRYAYTLMRAGQREKAVAAFEDNLKIKGQEPARYQATHRQIGYLLALLRRFDEAVAAYDRGLAIQDADPTMRAEIYVMRGHSLNKLERYDDAVASYLSGAAIEEANYVTRQTAYVAAGTMHQRHEEYGPAVENFQKAVDLGAKSHYGHRANNHLIECRAALEGSETFFFKPYVTNLDSSEAHVTWVSRGDAPTGYVEVAGKRFDAERTDLKDIDAFRQVAKITGLDSGERYPYVAHCGGEQVDGTFMTAPTDGRPIRFSVIGDTQGGHAVHAEVARDIAEYNPDFVVHVGDCVERGQRWDEWKVQVFDPGRPYLKSAPIWPARGNHDGGPYFTYLFGRDGTDYKDYRYGDVHVFVMDSQYSVGGSAREKQLAWLRDGLTHSDAKWKLVALHHPMIIVPAPWKPFGQEDFLEVVQTCGADVVITGHYHVYTRLRPLIKKGADKPVLHLVTGGGGGNMGSYTPSPLTVKYDMDHHHLDFIAEGDTLRYEAKHRDNVLLDSYTVGDPNVEPIDLDLAKSMTYFYHKISHPNYRREDMVVKPGDGKLTLLHPLLDEKTLPESAELRVRVNEDDPWQVMRIGKGEWDFKGDADFKTMQLQLCIGDVEFESDTFDVIFDK